MSEARSEEFPWLARLLQMGDSAFPTGGYAHSHGFEQIVQFGLVTDAETMGRYLEDHLWSALIHFELPVVRFAQEAARQGDLADLLDLDSNVDATRTARELREASRAMGARRRHALVGASATPVFRAFAAAIENGETPGHHTVVYGAGLAAMPPRALLISWAYQSLSAVCLAAPKLLRLGQDAAQRELTATLSGADEKVDRSVAITRDAMGWFDPLVEIASLQHEIADERLFIS